MRAAIGALALALACASTATAADVPGQSADAPSPQTQTPPLTFLCTGVAQEATSNGSLLNVPYHFRLVLWKGDPWRATYDGRPIGDLTVTDDTLSFVPPSVSALHTLLRAYADVGSLGLAAKARVLRIDRQTGAYQSGYASGTCSLVSPDERLF